jgi:RNase adaptor protein for sRNA GlmZ degradation
MLENMRIIILSRLSGSGKSTVLGVSGDAPRHCAGKLSSTMAAREGMRHREPPPIPGGGGT